MESGEKGSLDPQAAGLVTDEGGAERTQPFYKRGSFWMGPFMLLSGLVIAVVIGAGWYILGGFPGDQDKYGVVNVPGQVEVELPGEEVRLNHENDASRSGDTTHLADQPDGLEVRVTPADGGEPLALEEVPSWLFCSTTNDRGHEPYRKVEIPSEGRYLVEATAEGLPPLGSRALARAPQADDQGPEVTIGAAPWNPLGSKLAGAILAGVVVFLLAYAFTLPFKLIGRRS